jgi:predicted DNA-binding ribbon-helix-helix protein
MVMVSKIEKRSIVLGGHKTSISLEQDFWDALKEIARLRQQTISAVIGEIDAARKAGNLSSNLRVFVLRQYRKDITPQK